MTINLADLAFAQWTYEEEIAFQKAVVAYRDYYDGDQASFLTDRLKEFLNVSSLESEFRMNVCRPVVSAVVERLICEGCASPDEAQQEFADAVWTANKMPIQANDVHRNTLTDGESFVIVDFDPATRQARLTPHQRFASSEAGGDDEGCKATYVNDNVNMPMRFASKRWLDTTTRDKSFRRMTVYYPDRVEKYEMSGNWIPFTDEDNGVWPLPWVDAQGQPLGIPVVHFKQPSLKSELSDAVFMQNAINKTLVDLLASADVNAFRILYTFGFIPTTDGKPLASDRSNLLTVKPGSMIATSKAPNEVSIGALEGTDPTPLLNMLSQFVMWLSVVTDTPTSRFQFTGQIAAEGTLKQQNETLFAKVRNRKGLLGESWAGCMAMARRLSNVFGGTSYDESIPFTCAWQATDSRSDSERQAEWTTKKNLGVPLQQIWSEMGYTLDEITAMWQMREDEAMMQARVAASTGIPIIEEVGNVATT